jgi:hypothetical protein
MLLFQLKEKIQQAKSCVELQNIVNSIPNQKNSFKTKIQRLLENCFFYVELENNLELQKEWLLKRVNSFNQITY